MNSYVRVMRAGVAAVSLGLFAAADAHAGCTLNEDVGAVRRSINSISRCNDRQLRKTGVTCKLHAAPTCSGSLVDDAIALGYGPLNTPSFAVDVSALRDQLTCQKHVGRGISGYVASKLSSLIHGSDPTEAEEKARRRLDRISDHCL